MYKLETSLATILYKACVNVGEAIGERLIKPIASIMFGHLEYFLDGPGPLIAVSGPHREFFNSAFGIWICGK